MANHYLVNRKLFSDVYLERRLTGDAKSLRDEALASMEAIQSLREMVEPSRFKRGKEYQLRQEYLDHVLEALGWTFSGEGKIPTAGRPDYALFLTEQDKRTALKARDNLRFFEIPVALCEAKGWGVPLTKAGRRETAARGQLYAYLEASHIDWGIVTNGDEWMLVCRRYSRAQQRDLTFHLTKALTAGSLDDFLPFFALFSRAGFQAGLPEKVLRESVRTGDAVGKNLKNNVYRALALLGNAIVQARPSLLEQQNGLKVIKEAALVILYRILFISYAESSDFLPMEEGNHYRRAFSLLRIKEQIKQDNEKMDPVVYQSLPNHGSHYWRNLSKLFDLIDKGLPIAGIPAYNGGLFSPRDDSLLQSIELDDRTVAQVVDLLSRSRDDPDWFLDYSTLGVRELGSIYEGLLEYQFKTVEGKKKSVELVSQSGERKTSGSYYTPHSVVEYIVRRTLRPVIEAKLEAAKKSQKDLASAILSIKVLDPAMGSGHFLVTATEYLAEELLRALEASNAIVEIDEETEAWAKRLVVAHCIYGVDLNEMAVELAKVSLWLTTFSKSHPLTFLDHRLKTGNSLIGSFIENISHLPEKLRKSARKGESSPPKLLFSPELLTRFKRIVRKIEDTPDDTIKNVEEKQQAYEKLVGSTDHIGLRELGNSHTALFFMTDADPKSARRQWGATIKTIMEAGGLQKWAHVLSKEWIKGSIDLVRSKEAFHWDLEYPDVFHRENPGFDAVIGNPPYVRIYRGSIAEEDRQYFQERFKSAHKKFDLYLLFLELGTRLTRKGGKMSMIVPDKFLTSPYGEPLRIFLLRAGLKEIADLRHLNVFPGVGVHNLIPVVEKGKETDMIDVMRPDSLELLLKNEVPWKNLTREDLKIFPESQIRIDADVDQIDLLKTLLANQLPLDDGCYVNWGLRTGTKEKTERMVTGAPSGRNPKPLLRGADILDKYVLAKPSQFIDYQVDHLYNPMFPELFESEKLVVKKIVGKDGIVAAKDSGGNYCFSTVICVIHRSALKEVKRPGTAKKPLDGGAFRNMDLLSAIVNSTIIKWWYKQMYSDDIGVNPNHVKAIPLPKTLAKSASAGLRRFDSAHKDLNIEKASEADLVFVITSRGKELNRLGDNLAQEKESFIGWLETELGLEWKEMKGRSKIEDYEKLSRGDFVAIIRQNKGIAQVNPTRREVQDRLAQEWEKSSTKIRELADQMMNLQHEVDQALCRAYGLPANSLGIMAYE